MSDSYDMVRARRYKPRAIVKTVASSATPEALSSNSGIRMAGVTFLAQKAVGTDNVGNVNIQIDGSNAKQLTPGEQWSWPMPPYGQAYFSPTDFTISVATNGDGVIALYTDIQ